MTSSLPPHVLLILGALVVPFLRGRARSVYMLALPVASFAVLLGFDEGSSVQITAFGYELTLARLDQLSLVWAYIFHIALFLGMLFALHVRSATQHVAAVIYAASALGAVLAGDPDLLLGSRGRSWRSSSTFLVLARPHRQVHRRGHARPDGAAGLGPSAADRHRPLRAPDGVHRLRAYDAPTGGGSIFDLEWSSTRDPADLPRPRHQVRLAAPARLDLRLLSGGEPRTGSGLPQRIHHEGRPSYALCRALPRHRRTDLDRHGHGPCSRSSTRSSRNDVRRVLCYSMINQIGFMVVGIGVGTELALNGDGRPTRFCHILYKMLLFHGRAGAVLFRTGRGLCTELGRPPSNDAMDDGASASWGAASISAFPLFSGFVAKSLIMIATAEAGYTAVWMLLLFAAAGVFHHAGIKIPYFIFFEA